MNLSKIFDNRQAVVFCGAGISLEPPAGLPDWNKLRDYTLEAIASKDRVLQKFLNELTSTPMIVAPNKKGLVPEIVASEITKSCSGYFEAFRALKEGEPNANHRYLAILAKSSLLKYIITTNFDVFIEQALEQQGVTYKALATEQQFEQFLAEKVKKNTTYIFKIHGCINNPNTITATVEQEAKGLCFAKIQVLRQLLQQYYFIFWGYSGADLKIDLDYLQMVNVQKTAKGFVWNFLETDRYKETVNPYVRKLAEIYKQKAQIVHGKLPQVFDDFVTSKNRIQHIKYSASQQKKWLKKKNTKLQKDLNLWAKTHLMREEACFIFAKLLRYSGQIEKALQCYEHTKKLYKRTPQKLAMVYNGIGLIYDLKGEYEKALLYYEQQRQICLNFNNKQALANCLNNIGMVYKAMGDYASALSYFEKAIEITKILNNSKELAAQLNNIGSIFNIKGQYEKALQYYEQAKEIDHVVGNKWGVANSLNNIGTIYHSQGDYNKAIENYREAEEINRAMGDIGELATSLNNIAIIYNQQQNYPSALDYFKKAQQMYHHIDDRQGMADCLGNIGSVYEFIDMYDYSLEYQLQALEIDTSIGNLRGMAHRLNNIGGIYDIQDDLDTALDYYNKAKQLYQDLEDSEGVATTLNNIGKIHHMRRDLKSALVYLNKSLNIVEEIQHIELCALFSRNIGYIYHHDLNQHSQAMIYYEKSLEYYILLEDQQEIIELQELIADCSRAC